MEDVYPLKKLLDRFKLAVETIISADRELYCAYLVFLSILAYLVDALERADESEVSEDDPQ